MDVAGLSAEFPRYSFIDGIVAESKFTKANWFAVFGFAATALMVSPLKDARTVSFEPSSLIDFKKTPLPSKRVNRIALGGSDPKVPPLVEPVVAVVEVVEVVDVVDVVDVVAVVAVVAVVDVVAVVAVVAVVEVVAVEEVVEPPPPPPPHAIKTAEPATAEIATKLNLRFITKKAPKSRRATLQHFRHLLLI